VIENITNFNPLLLNIINIYINIINIYEFTASFNFHHNNSKNIGNIEKCFKLKE